MVSWCSYAIHIPFILLRDLILVRGFHLLLNLGLEGLLSGDDWIFYAKFHMGWFQCELKLEQGELATCKVFLQEFQSFLHVSCLIFYCILQLFHQSKPLYHLYLLDLKFKVNSYENLEQIGCFWDEYFLHSLALVRLIQFLSHDNSYYHQALQSKRNFFWKCF